MFSRIGSRIGGSVLALALAMSCTGCSQIDISTLDADGDGMISRSDLLAALFNSFCPSGGTTEEPGSGTGTGTNTDPATDGN